MSRALVLTALISLASCSSGDAESGTASAGATEGAAEQSVAEGWKAFCEISEKRDPRKLAPSERMAMLSKAANVAIRNPEVSAVFESLGKASLTERDELLHAALDKAKVDRCHLAEYLKRELHEQNCRLSGAAEDCLFAGEIYRTASLFAGEEQRVAELSELACLHGSAPGCRQRAGDTAGATDPWLGAACRRGDTEACVVYKGPVVRTPLVSVRAREAVGDRLRQVYAASIVDCAVNSGLSASNQPSTVAVRFALQAGKTAAIKVDATDSKLAACVEHKATRWVFGSEQQGDEHEIKVAFDASEAQSARDLEAAADQMRRDVEADVARIFAEDPGLGGMTGGLGAEDLGGVIKGGPGADLSQEIEAGDKLGGAGTDSPNKGPPPRSILRFGHARLEPESTLTSSAVVGKLRRLYANGLKRCHKQLLKKRPQARGKMKLVFTISGRGKVGQARASGFDLGVDKCVESQASKWRFARPLDEARNGVSVEVTTFIDFRVQQL